MYKKDFSQEIIWLLDEHDAISERELKRAQKSVLNISISNTFDSNKEKIEYILIEEWYDILDNMEAEDMFLMCSLYRYLVEKQDKEEEKKEKAINKNKEEKMQHQNMRELLSLYTDEKSLIKNKDLIIKWISALNMEYLNIFYEQKIITKGKNYFESAIKTIDIEILREIFISYLFEEWNSHYINIIFKEDWKWKTALNSKCLSNIWIDKFKQYEDLLMSKSKVVYQNDFYSYYLVLSAYMNLDEEKQETISFEDYAKKHKIESRNFGL